MNIAEIIQNIATASAVVLGLTYVIGGLIVNINLTRRGLVEYQILKVKYLVVGIIFLLQSLGTFIFAGLPAFALLLWANNLLLLQGINILSMLASISLLVVWSRYSAGSKSFVIQWQFWFIASTLGAVFPMLVLLRQLLSPNGEWLWVIVSAQAVMTAALNFMSQIYHYSAFYYGRPRPNRELDPIGIGIPTRIDLVCDKAISSDLSTLGLPMENNIIRDVYLIDETDQHYIVAMDQIPGANSKNETYKIGKTLVKAILHKPENLKRLLDGTEKSKTTKPRKSSSGGKG